VDRNKGFTIIFGKNGEGKSNILNAINWCLYQTEPHGVKEIGSSGEEVEKMPIFNGRYIKEIKNGTKAEIRVDLWIQKGDTTYIISRTLAAIKHDLETKTLSSGNEQILIFNDDKTDIPIPKGCEVLEKPHSDFEVRRKGPTDSDPQPTTKEGTPEQMVSGILPKELSRFYLLDGDFLEKFWEDRKNIQEGIELISQLNLLTASQSHVKNAMPSTMGIGKEADTISLEIKELENINSSVDENGTPLFSKDERFKMNPDEEKTRFIHLSGKPRLNDLKEDKIKITKKLQTVKTDFLRIGGSTDESIKKEYKEKDDALDELDENLETARAKLMKNYVMDGPQYILKQAIEDTVKIINERIELGDLPNKNKKILGDYLLEKGFCICGEPLEPGHERTETLKEFMKIALGKENLDGFQELGWRYQNSFVKNFENWTKEKFGAPNARYAKLESDYDALTMEVTSLQKQLGNTGKTAQELSDTIDYHTQKLLSVQAWITELEAVIKENNSELGKKNIGLQTVLAKNERAARITYQRTIWENAMSKFNSIYDKLKKDIRDDVQKKTWSNWKSLLSNDSEFSSLEIDEEYNVSILDKHDFNKSLNLSAGQSLLLTLAFVAAIREPTGFKFPLIIDSPAGKIDGPNTHNIGANLPDFLPDAQVIMLVTSKEYTDFISPDPDYPDVPKTPVCELFREKIHVQHYRISKEKDNTNLNVGNSKIQKGKVVFNDESNHEGFMVISDE
jgi:DNA sulfur modification protein DndD